MSIETTVPTNPRPTSTLGTQLRVATLTVGSAPGAVLAVAEADLTRRMRAEGATPSTLAATKSWERRYEYALEQSGQVTR